MKTKAIAGALMRLALNQLDRDFPNNNKIISSNASTKLNQSKKPYLKVNNASDEMDIALSINKTDIALCAKWREMTNGGITYFTVKSGNGLELIEYEGTCFGSAYDALNKAIKELLPEQP